MQHSEAQQAVELAENIIGTIRGVSDVYVELSGQAAAAQKVVTDLQQSIAFLRARAGEREVQMPWTRTAPGRPASESSPVQILEPSPSTKAHAPVQGVQAPAKTRSVVSKPPTSSTTSRSGTGTSPQLQSAASGRTASKGPSLSRSVSANAAHSPPLPTKPSTRPASSDSKPASSSSCTGTTNPGTAQPSVRDVLQPLNIPRVMGVLPGTSPQQGALQSSQVPSCDDPGPGPAPQLPATFVKAKLEYAAVIQQCCQSLSQLSPQAATSSSVSPVDGDGGASCALYGQGCVDSASAGPVGLGSWSQVLSAAGAAYCSALQHHYHQHSDPAQPTASNLPALRYEAKVAFAALVGAHTWVLQALKDLQHASRGTGPGTTLESVQVMLSELPQLQQEYDAALAALQQAEMAAASRAHNHDQTTSTHTLTTTTTTTATATTCTPGVRHPHHHQSIIPIDRLAAAARWRNRFLRACLGGAAGQPGGPTGGSVKTGGRKQGAGGDAAAADTQQPTVPQVPVMSQPLGLWLPPQCWQPVMPQLLRLASVPHHMQEALQAVPWTLALPPALVHAAFSCQAASVEAGAVLMPAAFKLTCPSPHAHKAYHKAIMQLQHHVSQLWLEAHVGKVLDVAGMPERAALLCAAQACPRTVGAVVSRTQNSRRGDVSDADKQLERFLALLRLAQALVTKNAWNRTCCIAEVQAPAGAV